ncbi:MAG: hypothetical protein OXF64_04730 [bacterium]|nr:hypothetical protein [bacterium]
MRGDPRVIAAYLGRAGGET